MQEQTLQKIKEKKKKEISLKIFLARKRNRK